MHAFLFHCHQVFLTMKNITSSNHPPISLLCPILRPANTTYVWTQSVSKTLSDYHKDTNMYRHHCNPFLNLSDKNRGQKCMLVVESCSMPRPLNPKTLSQGNEIPRKAEVCQYGTGRVLYSLSLIHLIHLQVILLALDQGTTAQDRAFIRQFFSHMSDTDFKKHLQYLLPYSCFRLMITSKFTVQKKDLKPCNVM